jgi:methionyl-tRNA formyltransferase
VWRSRVVEDAQANIEPGKVVSLDDSLCAVKCGEGLLVLLETEPTIQLNIGSYL